MGVLEPVRTPDGNIEQFTLKVGGKPFRCSCGCNVFHKPDRRRLDLFECNACGTWFEAAEGENTDL